MEASEAFLIAKRLGCDHGDDPSRAHVLHHLASRTQSAIYEMQDFKNVMSAQQVTHICFSNRLMVSFLV